VRLYHTSIIRTQQVYSIHCHTNFIPSAVKSSPNHIHASYHNSSDSPLSQEGSEKLPQHNLPQDKHYNLSSDPPKNLPHNGTENHHSIPTKNHHSNGMAKTVSKDYHMEQIDTAHMQQGQYARDHFKYVEFGDEPDLTQGRKIIQSQTEVEHHSNHIRYPIRASQLQPGGQAVQAVPSRLQQRSRLNKLEVVKRNTTLLSRERVSMAIMKLSEQLFQLRGFPVAANEDLVTGRHFPPWKISSEVASHLEALQQVMNETELSRRNWTHYSLNKDIGARSKV